MKGSKSLSKTLAKIVAVCGSCFTIVPAFCCQSIVSASTVYSQEEIYNARLVFTSDVYSKMSNYINQKHYPTSIGTEPNGRTYLYFDNNINMKIKLNESQLEALTVLKNAFGLRDIMDVINDANTYIISDSSNYQKTSSKYKAPAFVQSSNQYPNFRISFNHEAARRKDVSSILGFPSKFLNSKNIKNFDNLFNYIQDRAKELIAKNVKLASKTLSRYKKALKAIDSSKYGSLNSGLLNFDYYVFAWGETLEKLEHEWDAVYKAYGDLKGASDNLCVCYKNNYNSYELVHNIDYNRDEGGLGVGTFQGYGYQPVRKISETLLSFIN